MPRPETLERWTPEELKELSVLAMRDLNQDAVTVAQKFCAKHTTRSLDATKQRVFKIRRDAKEGKPRHKGVTTGAIKKPAPPPRQIRGPIPHVAATTEEPALVSAPAPRRPAAVAQLMEAQTRFGDTIRGTPEDVLTVLRGLQAHA